MCSFTFILLKIYVQLFNPCIFRYNALCYKILYLKRKSVYDHVILHYCWKQKMTIVETII